MVKVMIGLLLGVSISAGTAYVMLPKTLQKEYDKGVTAGTAAGTEAGITAGTVKGQEQAMAEYQKNKEVTQANARAKEQEDRQNAAKARKAAPKPIQNWHVRGNQIAEPIRDETPTPKGETPAVTGDDTPA